VTKRKFCTGAEGFNHETQSCCERHDEAYSPLSHMSRYDADVALLVCVAKRGHPWRAMLMFAVCRLAGWAFYKGRG
jgi:hypothetical protein